MSGFAISYCISSNPDSTRFHQAYHTHSFDEILIICSGDIIAMTPNIYLTHKGPCVLFYKKNCPHAQMNGENVRYERYYLHFDRTFIADIFNDWSLFASFSQDDAFLLPLEGADGQRIIAAAALLHSYFTSGEASDIRLRLLLGYLFAEITETGKKQGCTPPVHFYLTLITQYISEHIADKPTINQLASQFHVGRTKLIQDFQEFFSMTIMEYITMERLNKARFLLQQGESVRITAEICGFSDSSHLIRVFRRNYHITPSAFQRQCSDNPLG